jgi:hypothetical protein
MAAVVGLCLASGEDQIVSTAGTDPAAIDALLLVDRGGSGFHTAA